MRSSLLPVIIHYGDPGPTEALAGRLVDGGLGCVVVSNDLTSRCEGLAPEVEWLVPPRNLGYFGALSWAMGDPARYAEGGVVVVLNTDIDITADQVRACADHLGRHPGVGIVGPNLRHSDGSLQSGAGRLSRFRRAPVVRVEPEGVTTCTWVTGAVMAVRHEVVRDVGLDATYFLGAEDLDLCIRAGRSGWTTQCLGDIRVRHTGSVVIGPRWYYYSTRNLIWYSRALFGRPTGALNLLVGVGLVPRVALADLLKRRSFLATRLMTLGLLHALRGKPLRSTVPPVGEPHPQRVMTW